jgi:hypothetical protein
MATERRWIILSEDGRHVTVGRATDPSEAEIQAAGKALRQTGQGGWLAILDGIYYARGAVSLMMVRELAPASASWEEAVAKFEQLRSAAIAPDRPKPV